jgi:hypothetical protein
LLILLMLPAMAHVGARAQTPAKVTTTTPDEIVFGTRESPYPFKIFRMKVDGSGLTQIAVSENPDT